MSIVFARTLRRLLDGLEYVVLTISGILVLSLIFLVTVSVFSRYAFGNPLAWNIEISEYVLMMITFFSASYLMKTGGHVGLDIVVASLPHKLHKATRIFSLATSLVGFAVFTYFALKVVLYYFDRGTTTFGFLRLQRWMLMSPIVIGSTLMILRLIEMLAAELVDQSNEPDRGAQ